MKRTLIGVALVMAVAAALGAANAHASVRWPAKCHNMKCVNAHLNNLNKRANAAKKQQRNDESLFFSGLVCEGDALVNETQNEADNATGITGEVGPIAGAVGIDCSTDFWPLFDPANFPIAGDGMDIFRAQLHARLD